MHISDNVSRVTFEYVNSRMESQTRALYEETHLWDKPLEIISLDEGVVFPCLDGSDGGVVDRTGHYYDYSFLHRGLVEGRAKVIECEEYINEEVVYVGMWHNVWGHWLTDNIKLLWFLFESEYSQLSSLSFVYTTLFPFRDIPANAISLLNALGVNEKQLVRIDKATRFKKVFLPDDCFIRWEKKGTWYTNEYKLMINRVVSFYHQTTVGSPAKVYFSRTHLQDSKEEGEERIESVFKRKGFRIYYPEELSLEDQINVLTNCRCFASTEGSVSHNALFLNEGTSLVLLRKAYYTNGYQAAINEMRKLKVIYIDSHMSSCCNKQFPYKGPFFLFCNKKLSEFAQVRQPLFPFLSYIKYVFRNRFKPLWISLLKSSKACLVKLVKNSYRIIHFMTS